VSAISIPFAPVLEVRSKLSKAIGETGEPLVELDATLSEFRLKLDESRARQRDTVRVSRDTLPDQAREGTE
jgi:hypothetical protein